MAKPKIQTKHLPTLAQMDVLHKIAVARGLTVTYHGEHVRYALADGSGTVSPGIVARLVSLGALLRSDGTVYPVRATAYRVRQPSDGR